MANVFNDGIDEILKTINVDDINDDLEINRVLDMKDQKIINLATPVYAYDGANKTYVDTAISSIPSTDLSNYYTKAQVDSKDTVLQNEINSNMTAITTVQGNVNVNTSDISTIQQYFLNTLNLTNVSLSKKLYFDSDVFIKYLNDGTIYTKTVNYDIPDGQFTIGFNGGSNFKYDTTTGQLVLIPVNSGVHVLDAQGTISCSGLYMNNSRIQNVQNGTFSDDAVTLGQLNTVEYNLNQDIGNIEGQLPQITTNKNDITDINTLFSSTLPVLNVNVLDGIIYLSKTGYNSCRLFNLYGDAYIQSSSNIRLGEIGQATTPFVFDCANGILYLKKYTDSGGNPDLDSEGLLNIQGNINLNNTGQIINLVNPVNPQDGATKNYVDTVATQTLTDAKAYTDSKVSGSNIDTVVWGTVDLGNASGGSQLVTVNLSVGQTLTADATFIISGTVKVTNYNNPYDSFAIYVDDITTPAQIVSSTYSSTGSIISACNVAVWNLRGMNAGQSTIPVQIQILFNDTTKNNSTYFNSCNFGVSYTYNIRQVEY